MDFKPVDFSNTKIAFQTKNNQELRNSYMLFKAIGYNWLVQTGPKLIELCFKLGLPVKGIIKKTVFHQFCGGENIQDCEGAIKLMHQFNVGTILDYSVEGEELEVVFEATTAEIIETIKKAANNPAIPFSVFKVTGIARQELLEKVNFKQELNDNEINEWKRVNERMQMICECAFTHQVRLFIDAEESWIQDTIDDLATQMQKQFNKEKTIIFNTLQMYRHDRLSYLKFAIAKAKEDGYYLGLKLVRGAYMEKERLRAKELGYIDPIQPNKQTCDIDYNEALKLCIENIERIDLCAGTHNEDSCSFLTQLMAKSGLKNGDNRIYFSQLFGMSDNLSYNLANSGYNVAKYLPYGPVKAVLPYLFRRAQENTSVQGQAGRELSLIQNELHRRRHEK